jgi:hypothetical protein
MHESRTILDEIRHIVKEDGKQTQRNYEDQKERDLLQDLTSDYEGYKDFNPLRVQGTCEWFFMDDRFRKWRDSNTSSLLWVSAGPGCGKSVLSLKSRSIDEHNKRRGYKADFYAKSLPVVLRGHSPTFTHGDFQRKNIIVRREKQSELAGHEDEYQVTLNDWEMAGWYPDYWEYCVAACAFRFSDDWPDKVGDILDPYLVEYPWLLNIILELWS